MINPYKRYQTGLTIQHLFPQEDKSLCACGCMTPLTGRQTRWHSKKCYLNSLVHFYIIKGNTRTIRDELFSIEHGFCRNCGVFDPSWQADHILPVSVGGGGCHIDNFQTLCVECHQVKSSFMLSHKDAISNAVSSIRDKRRLKDFLQDVIFKGGMSMQMQKSFSIVSSDFG